MVYQLFTFADIVLFGKIASFFDIARQNCLYNGAVLFNDHCGFFQQSIA